MDFEQSLQVKTDRGSISTAATPHHTSRWEARNPSSTPHEDLMDFHYKVQCSEVRKKKIETFKNQRLACLGGTATRQSLRSAREEHSLKTASFT